MARLRQQNPQNYQGSGNIDTEFANVIRYLNAAELGNKTLAELLTQLFDDDGVFDGPIEMRQNQDGDIEYRVGTYTDPEAGWEAIANIEDLRGAPGAVVGEIGAPIFHARADYVATAGQTTFSYAHESTDELLVYVNGLLKRMGASYDYQTNPTADTVTFNAGLSLNDKVTIFKVRTTAITGYTRSDTVTVGSQTVFPFIFPSATTQVQVYKNGILQREGGSYDYVTQPTQNTITFTSAVPGGNLVTILTVENTSSQAVTGLMLESTYADPTTGLIYLSKIGIADNAIAQAKVNGLVSGLASKAKLTVSATAPTNPSTGDMWHDTALTPNALKFWDGTQWLRTSPESSLPTFTTSNAGQFVKVNGAGTALVYGSVDLSSVVPLTQKGAANGVASLDSTGRLPVAQLPATLIAGSLYDRRAGAVTNGNYVIERIFRQKIQIEGISAFTSAGTCTLTIQVNGVDFGDAYSISSVPNETVIGTPIQVDASTASKSIGFKITSASSSADLEVTLAYSVVTS